MARDWGELETLGLLEARMRELAPDNSAPIPISVAQEYDINGNLVWGIHLHVKVKGVTEYDVEAYSKTYAGALRRAYLGLANEAKIRRQTNAANLLAGIAF